MGGEGKLTGANMFHESYGHKKKSAQVMDDKLKEKPGTTRHQVVKRAQTAKTKRRPPCTQMNPSTPCLESTRHLACAYHTPYLRPGHLPPTLD